MSTPQSAFQASSSSKTSRDKVEISATTQSAWARFPFELQKPLFDEIDNGVEQICLANTNRYWRRLLDSKLNGIVRVPYDLERLSEALPQTMAETLPWDIKRYWGSRGQIDEAPDSAPVYLTMSSGILSYDLVPEELWDSDETREFREQETKPFLQVSEALKERTSAFIFTERIYPEQQQFLEKFISADVFQSLIAADRQSHVGQIYCITKLMGFNGPLHLTSNVFEPKTPVDGTAFPDLKRIRRHHLGRLTVKLYLTTQSQGDLEHQQSVTKYVHDLIEEKYNPYNTWVQAYASQLTELLKIPDCNHLGHVHFRVVPDDPSHPEKASKDQLNNDLDLRISAITDMLLSFKCTDKSHKGPTIENPHIGLESIITFNQFRDRVNEELKRKGRERRKGDTSTGRFKRSLRAEYWDKSKQWESHRRLVSLCSTVGGSITHEMGGEEERRCNCSNYKGKRRLGDKLESV